MSFSIIKAITRWLAWRKPRYHSHIRTRRKRRSKPLFPKRQKLVKVKRPRARLRRKKYRNPEETQGTWKHRVAQMLLLTVVLWMGIEVFAAAQLLER